MEANLVEIFSSAQGEGPWVGEATIFVRFGGCDLRCAWCDSPGTWRPARRCRIECAPGSGRFREVDDPVALAEVEAALDALGPRDHVHLSLTGGEPLLQPEAVSAIARAGRARGLASYLETHGLAVEALERVVDDIDRVSMDWKLPSDVRWAAAPASAGVPADFAALHRRFLDCAARRSQVYVKVVVTPSTRDEELDAVCEAIAQIAPQTPLVLQPVTPFGRVRERPSAEAVLRWQRRCARRVAAVRVIPQTHRSYEAL